MPKTRYSQVERIDKLRNYPQGNSSLEVDLTAWAKMETKLWVVEDDFGTFFRVLLLLMINPYFLKSDKIISFLKKQIAFHFLCGDSWIDFFHMLDLIIAVQRTLWEIALSHDTEKMKQDSDRLETNSDNLKQFIEKTVLFMLQKISPFMLQKDVDAHHKFATVPKCTEKIFQLYKDDGRKLPSFSQDRLRRKIQDKLNAAGVKKYDVGGSAGTYYFIVDIAKAAAEICPDYTAGQYEREFEHISIPENELTKADKQNN